MQSKGSRGLAIRLGTVSLVRLPFISSQVQRYLYMGVTGVQIPRVESAQELRRIVQAAKFPPVGSRGLGNARAFRWGLDSLDFPRGWKLQTQRRSS